LSESGRKVGREGTVLCLKRLHAALKGWIIAMLVPQYSYMVLINLFPSDYSQKGEARISDTGMLSTKN